MNAPPSSKNLLGCLTCLTCDTSPVSLGLEGVDDRLTSGSEVDMEFMSDLKDSFIM
jgi:hypothetical protein